MEELLNDLIDREKLDDLESERGSNNEMDSNKSRSADSLSMLSKTLCTIEIDALPIYWDENSRDSQRSQNNLRRLISGCSNVLFLNNE